MFWLERAKYIKEFDCIYFSKARRVVEKLSRNVFQPKNNGRNQCFYDIVCLTDFPSLLIAVEKNNKLYSERDIIGSVKDKHERADVTLELERTLLTSPSPSSSLTLTLTPSPSHPHPHLHARAQLSGSRNDMTELYHCDELSGDESSCNEFSIRRIVLQRIARSSFPIKIFHFYYITSLLI